MKDFGKMLLAVVCGLLIVQIIKYLLLFMFIGSLSAIGSGSSKVLPKEGVLDLNLSEIQLSEQPAEMATPAFSLSGLNMQVAPVGLRDAVKALETAAADPGVKYVLLRPDNVSAGMADLEELRDALKEFRRSGKAVVAYTENPGNGSYYLSTVADKIYMGDIKGGTYQLVGVSATMLFLKDILNKLGVNVQLIRHGKYKSAGEMYIRSSSSAENREQNQVMINSAWHNMCAEITAAREQLIKMQENGEELDDSQLEQVAGGFAIAGTLFLIGMGVLVGGSIGVGIGAAVRENRESRGRRW